jgi:hypothetical protein
LAKSRVGGKNKNMSKIGRNDLCFCGSGKKYKKCCMLKENRAMIEEVDFAGRVKEPMMTNEVRGYGILEGLEKELEYLIEKRNKLNILDDEYLSNKRYAEEFGYPLTKYDILNLELLNLAGYLMGSGEIGEVEGIEELLIKAGKRLKETEEYIKGSIKAYKDETGKKIDYETKMDFKPFKIEKEILPLNIRKENVINFFYANIGLSLHESIANEIEKKYGKKRADEIGNAVFHVVMNYISRNCRGKCDDRCIKNMEESGYCDICQFGKEKLSCPKKEEISYNKIKASEKDMAED